MMDKAELASQKTALNTAPGSMMKAHKTLEPGKIAPIVFRDSGSPPQKTPTQGIVQ